MWNPTVKQCSEAGRGSGRPPGGELHSRHGWALQLHGPHPCACRFPHPSLLLSGCCCTVFWFCRRAGYSGCCRDREGRGSEPQSQVSSALTMPNGIKPVDPLDSLSSVSSAYHSSGQPSTCKYWILDLGTHASCTCPASLLSLCLFSFRWLLERLLCAFKQQCFVL